MRTPSRLVGPTQLTTTSTTYYTVPTTTQTLIRHMHFTNPSAGTVTLTVSIGADAAGTRIFDGYSLAAGTVFDHFCYYLLAAGEILQAKSNTATTVVATIDGDVFTLGY